VQLEFSAPLAAPVSPKPLPLSAALLIREATFSVAQLLSESKATRELLTQSGVDRIRDDLRRAFNCMAAMRSSLRQMLEEIKLEINRLNQDVYNCCGKHDFTIFDPPNINLNTVNPNIVPGPTFYGRTRFFDREVNVWQTNQGIIILPEVDPAANDVLLEPRLTRTASLAQFMQEEVRGTFQGRPVTKEEMLRTFGTRTLKSGHTVAEAIAILPDKVSYQTVDAMLDDVVEREARPSAPAAARAARSPPLSTSAARRAPPSTRLRSVSFRLSRSGLARR
jgi:hypothetical protein